MDWAYYMDNYKQKKHNKSNNAIIIAVVLIVIIIIILIIFFINKNQKSVIEPIINNKKPIIAHNIKNNENIDLRPQSVIDGENKITENLNKVYYSEQANPLIVGKWHESTNYKKPIYVQRSSDGEPLFNDTRPISKYGKIGYSSPRGLSEYNSAHYDKDVGNTKYIWRDGKLTNQKYEDMINSIESIDNDLYNNIAQGIYDKSQSEKNLQEISKKITYENNGIPQNWNLPSTSILNFAMNPKNNKSLEGGNDYYGIEGATPAIQDGLSMMFVPDHSPLM